MQTDTASKPRPPFWKAALHVAIATAVGNVLLAVAVWMGRRGEWYEQPVLAGVCVAFTATVLIVAILGGARKYTTLVILVSYLVGLVVAGMLERLSGDWLILWIPAWHALLGVVFSWYHPRASRVQVGLCVFTGMIGLVAAVWWAFVFFFLVEDIPGQPPSTLFGTLPSIILSIWGLVGFPLAIAVTVRLLIDAAEHTVEPSRLYKMALVPSALIFLAAAIQYSFVASLQGRLLRDLEDTVARGDTKFAGQLLQGDGHPDVNAMTSNQWTLLHCAASGGHVEIAAVLIRKGADVNARAKGMNVTPLHYAASGGRRDMVLFLLENGADPNVVETSGSFTPLDWARHAKRDDIVQLLRKRGGKSYRELKSGRKE